MIFGDALKTGLELPMTGDGKGYKDYKLSKHLLLRVRVLHMERPEDKIGADLVYKTLDSNNKTARLAIIQYKMWEHYDHVFHWDPRDDKQYAKMIGATCKSRLCDPGDETGVVYRLPKCTAFVRATDRLQYPNSATKSSSLHIPICVIQDAWRPNQAGGKSIRKPEIEGRCLSHRVFGELFNHSMVGSKQISWDEMTDIYRRYSVFDSDDRVVVHFQEAHVI